MINKQVKNAPSGHLRLSKLMREERLVQILKKNTPKY
jgi:hypothetical protein